MAEYEHDDWVHENCGGEIIRSDQVSGETIWFCDKCDKEEASEDWFNQVRRSKYLESLSKVTNLVT